MISECPAWCNDKWCEVKDLNVSVLDFGLIHCDATYDVISIKGSGEYLRCIRNMKLEKL